MTRTHGECPDHLGQSFNLSSGDCSCGASHRGVVPKVWPSWMTVKSSADLRGGDWFVFGPEIGGEGEVVRVESTVNMLGTLVVETEDFPIEFAAPAPVRIVGFPEDGTRVRVTTEYEGRQVGRDVTCVVAAGATGVVHSHVAEWFDVAVVLDDDQTHVWITPDCMEEEN